MHPVILRTAAPAILGLAFFQTACGEKVEEEGAVEIHLSPVEVIELSAETEYPVEERFVGAVEARRRSSLAFELSGTVDVVHFDEGESVKKGEIIAEIDTSRLEARESELLASQEQAAATAKLAETTFARDEKLVRSNAVAQQQLDQSQESLDNATANLARIEAQLESVRVDLAKSSLRAPYDGTLSMRSIDEGAVVSPSRIGFELLETGDLEVRAALASDAMSSVAVGDPITVRFGRDRIATFPVARILPMRNETTQTVDVILSVPSGSPELRDGDLVDLVRKKSVDADGFFLPRDALTESARGLWACFVAVPDQSAGPGAHRLDRRDLEVIEEYADSVYARGGIGDGDWVLSSGIQKIAPGQRVRIANVIRKGEASDASRIVERED